MFNEFNPFGTAADEEEGSESKNEGRSSQEEERLKNSNPNNKVENNNNEVVNLESSDEQDNKPKNENSDDSDYCELITISQLTQNLEAKHTAPNKCLINILSKEESMKVCQKTKKRVNEEIMIKEAKKKKYKTLPSNIHFNPVSQKIEKIDSEFDELIHKEFETSNYRDPEKERVEKREAKKNELTEHQKHLKLLEKAKFMGIKPDFSLAHENPSDLIPKKTGEFPKFDKKVEKNKNNEILTKNSPIRKTKIEETNKNNSNKKPYHPNKTHQSYHPPKENKLDLLKIKSNIIKEIYHEGKENMPFVKLFFKESKKFCKKSEKKQKNYSLSKYPENEEDFEKFYKTGIYLFKNLCYELINHSKKNNNYIFLEEKDEWSRGSLKSFIVELSSNNQNRQPSLTKKRPRSHG